MNSVKPRFPKAAPDGLLAAVFLAFLATAGLFYVNILAAIVDGLVSGMGLSEGVAGDIGSANIYGAALGAIIAFAVVKRLPWRPMAVLALIGLITLDLGSIAIRSAEVLLPLRFVHGLIGGFLVGTAFSVIARTQSPDRTFGMLLFVQFGLGGLGVMFLPRLVPIFGTQALFLSLAAFSFATLLMVPFLDRYDADRVRRPLANKDKVRTLPLVQTLAAIFLFQMANMALLAFIIRLGRGYGLDTNFVSMALGLATWIALIGPLVVMVIGLRFGRFWPLAIGIVLTLVGTALFHLSASPWAYLLANCGTGITWGMAIAYLFGMTAEFDKSGRTSALGGFISKLGLATGPMIAGRVLDAGLGFGSLINLALIGLALSGFLMLFPARNLDRVNAQNNTQE
ncbi:MAG: YbfB/YjiJ family MFS transporter [Robiginitomaculum sp.]|nr:YbfB/YjiJ family MFS transporter [Robiginitomaculum sp.]